MSLQNEMVLEDSIFALMLLDASGLRKKSGQKSSEWGSHISHNLVNYLQLIKTRKLRRDLKPSVESSYCRSRLFTPSIA